ncbi:ABC transporter substrate-binding protein [Haloechinothrix sp. YIM 98757]|uniref:ABC transporter substrate-binding protein n=1 Tax=Haloechinothrix aidingensis TaxID=2752311 RepID=A0A838A9Z4_9PSEU|nr:ABC transporter substrate-binding protein [Haloechinothrix aidingensis]MBA0125741.1 ABC transporter substrate-binding protein [Haloechinothrix aidingensis]
MPSRRRTVVPAALFTAAALVLAACGTRLDHDTIERAASGPFPGAEQDADAGGMPDRARGDSGDPDATERQGDGDPDSTAGAGADGRDRGAGGSDGPARDRKGSAGGAPIVVGTVGTYSGPGGTAFAQGARALQAWAAHTNDNGGIGGRRVEAIVMDDGGDAGRARSQMQELVEQHDAVAVVAAMTITETLNSWKGYVTEHEVPVIGGDCGPQWSDSPVLFRQCPSSASAVFGTARIGAQRGESTRFGALFCTESDSCARVENQLFDEGDAERAGLDPRYRARISLTQPDYTAECIQARNAGVELLMVTGDPGTVARVASSCQRQDYDPQFLQISSTVRADTVTKQGLGDVLVGMPVFPFAGLNTPAFEEFAAAWDSYGGDSAPGPSAALGWSSAKVFEAAAEAAGDDITRQSIIDALRGFDGERFDGLTVPLTFGPDGTSDVSCAYAMRGTDGGWDAPDGDSPDCW